MSKFEIAQYGGNERAELLYRRDDGCSFNLNVDKADLPALYACVGAAMAESRPRKCVCSFQHQNPKNYPICESGFVAGRHNPRHCASPLQDGSRCAHDEACHHPQEPASQRNEQ